MAINKNHEFEELNGIKCAIVEKNATPARVSFLKDILEYNRYEVVVAESPAPKVAPSPKPVTATENSEPVTPAIAEAPAPSPPPATYTIGVTDVRFNPTNAIFGRMLKTKEGNIVTLAYWQEKEPVPRDEVPYFAK